MISEDIKKKIIDFLEIYECKTNGKWNLNGGYARIDDVKIIEKNNSYIISAGCVEIGDYFDEEHPNHEVFFDIWWVIDKEDFHMLTNDELIERHLMYYEDLFEEEKA